MAPTICSGKKPQTRSIATTSTRCHGQGSHQLNHTLSNILHFVGRSSLTSKVADSLRIQTPNVTERSENTTSDSHSTNNEADLNYNLLTHTNATSASSYHEKVSFISDNAVTSSILSDTENSFQVRLSTEFLSNDSTETYGSNTTDTSNSSSLSDTISVSYYDKQSSSPTLQRQEQSFKRHSSAITQNNNNLTGDSEYASDSEETDLCKSHSDNGTKTINKQTKYYPCSDFDSDEDELQNSSDFSDVGSDNDMDIDESNSKTSLNTDKIVKLKSGNHFLLRDKRVPTQQTTNRSTNGCTKSSSNQHNTDGLLSIAIKTIKLVRRNQLLQQRLTQLQLETSEFIESVLANPENCHFRKNLKQKV